MMKSKKENGVLTIYLRGNIDSANAPEIEHEINEVIGDNSFNSLVLDADELVYISSAGLRIVLRLIKRYRNVKMINASSDVYSIFEMTGFTELLEVEKAMRKYSVDNCEVIGAGANGKVYRVARDTIVKVYKPSESLDDIKKERELARTAFLLGIPTAIPYDVVKVGDCYGSVFELLNAKSFDELMIEDESNLEFVARECVNTAKIIHSTEAPDSLPRQLDTAKHWLVEVDGYFEPDKYAKLKELIYAIPDSDMMLHGDFHIKNIMLQNDETLIIDMDTLCSGHPIFELAFMYNAYKGFGIVDKGDIERFLGISAETAYSLWWRCLELYIGTNDAARLNEVEDKAAVIGLLRVMRRILRLKQQDTPNGKAVIAACKSSIGERLDRLDSLVF